MAENSIDLAAAREETLEAIGKEYASQSIRPARKLTGLRA